MGMQKIYYSQNIWGGKNKSWRINTSKFWDLTVNQEYSTDIMERSKESKSNPRIYGWLIFSKVPRKFNGRRIIFSTSGTEAIGYPYAKKINLDTCLIPYTKISSKWIMNWNIRGNHKRKSSWFGIHQTFHRYDMKSKTYERKIMINWTSSKFKNNIKKMETDEEEAFANHLSGRNTCILLTW